jgi:hypothetical protein
MGGTLIAVYVLSITEWKVQNIYGVTCLQEWLPAFLLGTS